MNLISRQATKVIGLIYNLIKDDGKKLQSTHVVMVVIAKHDWNGAMSIPTYFEIVNFFTRRVKLVYKTASTLEEINVFAKELKSGGNKIQGLWIRAHGNPEKIRFGNHASLSFYDQSNSLRPTFDALEKEANIVLGSCSTGNSKYGMSIAERISHLSKRKVYAPKHKSRSAGTTVAFEANQLKATFMKRKNYKNTFINFICIPLFILFPARFGKDMTVCFEAEKGSSSPT